MQCCFLLSSYHFAIVYSASIFIICIACCIVVFCYHHKKYHAIKVALGVHENNISNGWNKKLFSLKIHKENS